MKKGNIGIEKPSKEQILSHLRELFEKAGTYADPDKDKKGVVVFVACVDKGKIIDITYKASTINITKNELLGVRKFIDEWWNDKMQSGA